MSTLAALGLDIYVHRKQASRGMYRMPDIDLKQQPEATRGPFTDQRYGDGGLAAPRDSDVEGTPRPSMGPYDEQSGGLMRDADTGYRGARDDGP